MSELEQFLKDTETDVTKVDVLDAPLIPDTSEKTTEEGKEDEGAGDDKSGQGEGAQPRNRRERRMKMQLDAERNASAFLAGKLEARTEAQKSVSEESDYLKGVERIYGAETPEAQLATELLKKAIVGARDDAENRAYERIKEETRKEADAQRAAESELDQMIEEIEDEHNVTLTEAQQRGYFQLMQKMSPKDADGNVTEYADPDAVWEVFQEKLQKRSTTANPAKDMSSRSMTSSGSSTESKLNDDVHQRFLREQGII